MTLCIMARNNIFALFLAWQAVQLIPLIIADSVLDLGSTDQYDAEITPPSLTGKTVWMSLKGSTDITMALSPDMQAQLKDTLGKCQGRDNACFQALTSLMHSSDIEIDGRIEKRGFAQLLSKTFKSIGAEFTLFVSMLLAMWQANRQPELGTTWQFPGDRASQAASVTNGVPLTLSAGGSPLAVVTPTAPPSSVTGSVTPGVSSISTATLDSQPGDYVITLDANLASGLDEVVRRFTRCEEDSMLGLNSAKRASNPYGRAVCGAIGGLTQAARGGPAHDFALIEAPQIPLPAEKSQMPPKPSSTLPLTTRHFSK